MALPSATAATLSWSALSAADAGSYTVVVTGAGGSVTSGSASLVVRPPNYTGSYFGTFATGGSFALQVRADYSAVFLGYASGSQATFIARDVAVDSAGRFRVSTFVTTPSSARVAAATIEYTVDATISAAGLLTGLVNGATALTATRSAATGVSQTVAGFYQAGAANSSATSYAIVGPAGQAFVLTVMPAGTDAGTGTVDAAGRLTVTTAANATVAGTLGTATATLSATVTTATGAKLNFIGASDTRVATEKLVNIATRGAVGGSAGEMIAGFVLRGDAPKAVMIRAIGPALGGFGVAGALTAPGSNSSATRLRFCSIRGGVIRPTSPRPPRASARLRSRRTARTRSSLFRSARRLHGRRLRRRRHGRRRPHGSLRRIRKFLADAEGREHRLARLCRQRRRYAHGRICDQRHRAQTGADSRRRPYARRLRCSGHARRPSAQVG